MPVSYETYERVALEDPEGQWELVCGRPRQKPDMTTEHNSAMRMLNVQLTRQLDEMKFVVATDSSKVRVSNATYYIPDLVVLPRAYERTPRQAPGTFEVYGLPMPLVVEVWSPSTGEYDVESRFPEYQQRGDAEI